MSDTCWKGQPQTPEEISWIPTLIVPKKLNTILQIQLRYQMSANISEKQITLRIKANILQQKTKPHST
ncbi:hypothetical protein TanjilG_00943 [Lupinus angustifolius]|uniref:Uncharacterized protein n=1 Tax=Lupinus angustifolius TaxID=3871 RepID=A0A4P1QQX9_LUPAN|nr:hypothetical protein TanjilG_00943 [Lupinus angustifolius]